MLDRLEAFGVGLLGAARWRLFGELFRFSVVGVAGFVVDATVLLAALPFLGPWVGRGLSYLVAASATFALNRAWTFRQAPRGHLVKQWAKFLVLNLVGFAFNYATYALLLLTVPLVAAHPVLGVAAGSLAGLLGNFVVSRRYVFQPRAG